MPLAPAAKPTAHTSFAPAAHTPRRSLRAVPGLGLESRPQASGASGRAGTGWAAGAAWRATLPARRTQAASRVRVVRRSMDDPLFHTGTGRAPEQAHSTRSSAKTTRIRHRVGV